MLARYCPNKQEAHWRSLVRDVRTLYSGMLTESQIAGQSHRHPPLLLHHHFFLLLYRCAAVNSNSNSDGRLLYRMPERHPVFS